MYPLERTVKDGLADVLVYLGADLLASAGFHVFVPDFFKGENLDLPRLTTMSDEEK